MTWWCHDTWPWIGARESGIQLMRDVVRGCLLWSCLLHRCVRWETTVEPLHTDSFLCAEKIPHTYPVKKIPWMRGLSQNRAANTIYLGPWEQIHKKKIILTTLSRPSVDNLWYKPFSVSGYANIDTKWYQYQNIHTYLLYCTPTTGLFKNNTNCRVIWIT